MKTTRLLCLTLLLITSLGATAHAAKRDAVIVMPVRYTVVQFAFDVARIRPVELVAYDKGVGDEPLLLHVWDAAATDWKPADIAAYQDGSLFGARPKQAFLIGGDEALPAELADGSGWCKKVTRIPSLKVVDMANSMNAKLKFSGKEWKRLAQRHNLELADDNAERRRYGRYGKPGTQPSGPRPVNPLLARFRRAKKEAPEAAAPDDDTIEITPVDDAVKAMPSESPEADKGVPVPEVKAEIEAAAEAVVEPAAAPAVVAPEVDTPAEFK
ncbi:MAG: hypothetical protein HN919_15210 [Verrucomicrobia bacterium]|jgi:hypothetical protein|nr:hypothetical protein [Verrucomicrobiota bacterium]MBT7067648.1 hypothetical protein [Verrucomicrobiota bacterium]MBT7701397.1 hypothetical protein [Verrucomicrobiota bacterium]